MKNFDDILKNSVEGFEAPYNPSAWENVSSQLNSPMDQAIKDSVDKYEAPANPQVWSNISKQLGPANATWKWIGGTAAAITLILGSVYLLDNNKETENNDNNLIVQDVDNTSDQELVVISDFDESDENISDDNSNNVVIDESDENNGVNVVNPNDNNIVVNHPQDNNVVNGGNGNNPVVNGNDGNSGNGVDNNMVDNSNQNNSPDPIHCNAAFTSDYLEACVGTEFMFRCDDINQDVVYLWSFGDGTYSSGAGMAYHAYTRPGNYTVTLTLKDKKDNKSLKHSEIEVVSNPLPTVDFTWEDANSMIPAINFINLTDDAQSWTWDIKGLKTSTENEFEYTFRKKGTYMVSLDAENEFGCHNSVEKPVTVEDDYNLFAPTAFSPNGDNDNDNFIPMALPIMNNPVFTMTIYDKAGKLVYQTNDVNAPWDGRSTSDNTPAPNGAYVWAVELTNENGEVEIYKGQVIIIR